MLGQGQERRARPDVVQNTHHTTAHTGTTRAGGSAEMVKTRVLAMIWGIQGSAGRVLQSERHGLLTCACVLFAVVCFRVLKMLNDIM